MSRVVPRGTRPNRHERMKGRQMGNTTDTPGATGSKLEKILALVPRTLSSDAHIVFLGGCLGIYLVALALLGVNSDLGAFIAAGLTVHLARRHSGRTAQPAGSVPQTQRPPRDPRAGHRAGRGRQPGPAHRLSKRTPSRGSASMPSLQSSLRGAHEPRRFRVGKHADAGTRARRARRPRGAQPRRALERRLRARRRWCSCSSRPGRARCASRSR